MSRSRLADPLVLGELLFVTFGQELVLIGDGLLSFFQAHVEYVGRLFGLVICRI